MYSGFQVQCCEIPTQNMKNIKEQRGFWENIYDYFINQVMNKGVSKCTHNSIVQEHIFFNLLIIEDNPNKRNIICN
jgi:hypothetical protein